MNKIFLALIFIIGCEAEKEHSTSAPSTPGSTSEKSLTSTGKENIHIHNKDEVFYTCSMHPEIKESEPGECPICGMNLTKMVIEQDNTSPSQTDADSSDESVSPDEVIASVKLRKSQLNHFHPSFFAATPLKMSKEIRLLGRVEQTEEKESTITARIDGRVEKVFVKSTGSYINRGDPVVSLYSPKLITTGEEYISSYAIYSKNKKAEFKELYQKAEERLKQWGIRKYQYQSWYKNGKVPRNIVIYSQNSGTVRKRNATIGAYFKEGQNFFLLSDLSEIWVEMDVYEQDAGLVKIGQDVELTFTALPGEVLQGKLDFINPVLNRESRTLTIRTTIPNPNGKLKPGMVADTTLKINFPGEPLAIPRNAVIDSGKRKVVWVRLADNKFQAQEINTGIESEGFVEVKSGLAPGQKVVIEGNFLLDAQAQLFGGYSDVKTSNHQHQHQH